MQAVLFWIRLDLIQIRPEKGPSRSSSWIPHIYKCVLICQISSFTKSDEKAHELYLRFKTRFAQLLSFRVDLLLCAVLLPGLPSERDSHDGGFEWTAVSSGEAAEKRLTVMLTGLTAEEDRQIRERSTEDAAAQRSALRVDWLDRRVELQFPPQRAWIHEARWESSAFELVSNVSGSAKPGVQKQI